MKGIEKLRRGRIERATKKARQLFEDDGAEVELFDNVIQLKSTLKSEFVINYNSIRRYIDYLKWDGYIAEKVNDAWFGVRDGQLIVTISRIQLTRSGRVPRQKQLIKTPAGTLFEAGPEPKLSQPVRRPRRARR